MQLGVVESRVDEFHAVRAAQVEVQPLPMALVPWACIWGPLTGILRTRKELMEVWLPKSGLGQK